MINEEIDFPAYLAVWDPAMFPDQRDWHYKRLHFAPQFRDRELQAITWLNKRGYVPGTESQQLKRENEALREQVRSLGGSPNV